MSISFHRMRKTRKSGYVYLAKCVECKTQKGKKWFEGAYKIGFTTQTIEQRMKLLEREIEGKVEVIDYFWSEDPAREEAEIHHTWKQYKIYREWYDFPENMVATGEQREPWFSSDERGFVDSIYNEKPSTLNSTSI